MSVAVRASSDLASHGTTALFGPLQAIPEAAAPPTDVYLVTDIDRGDELGSWRPDEALPAILAAGRTPLTLPEGIHWLLQQPDALERNHRDQAASAFALSWSNSA